MSEFTMNTFAVSLLTVSLLAGCGGGGGDSAPSDIVDNPSTGADDTPPVTGGNGISDSNADFVAAAALFGVSQGLIASTTPDFPIEVSDAPAKTLHTIVDAAPCGFSDYGAGGTMSVIFDDADDDQQLSPPDTFTTAFDNCKFISNPYTMDGAMIITNGSITGNPVANVAPWTMSGTLTFVNYGSSAPNETVVMNGKLDFDAASADGTTQTSQATSSDVLVVFNNAVSAQYDALKTTVTVGPVAGINTSSATSAGKARITGVGEVTLSTLSPWVYQGSSEYPNQGSIQLVGANGASVIVKAINNQTVELQIDSNGDGQADSVRERAWSALLEP